VTAALRIDEPFRLRASLPEEEQTASGKTLCLDCPDAEFCYVLPGTILRVTDGALVKQGSGSALRNDKAKLEAVAAAAMAWYSEQRAQLGLTVRQLVGFWRTDSGEVYELRPGAYVAEVQATVFDTEPVGGVVTRVAYDFGQDSVAVETDWAEMNASGIVEFPGIGGERAVAREIIGHDQQIQRLREAVDYRPRHPTPACREVRFTAMIVDDVPVGYDSIPTDRPVYAVQKVYDAYAGGDPLALPDYQVVTGPAAVHTWATNIAEGADSHALADDADLIVEVVAKPDASTPPLWRLTFDGA